MRISREAMREITEALEAYREEVEETRLRPNTKGTYLRHAENFVRWLQDDFEPEDRCDRAEKSMSAGAFDSQQQYIDYLRHHATRYLSMLEAIFGPRDPRFDFGTIGLSDDDRPRTHYPIRYSLEGGCRVDILISTFPWMARSPHQGRWQIAHECVHLLDPGLQGTANVLEEGLASWFQNEPRFHDPTMHGYIEAVIDSDRLPEYVEAEDLVRSNLPGILGAVKEIRRVGVRIREIKAGELSHMLPDANTATLERLCGPFS